MDVHAPDIYVHVYNVLTYMYLHTYTYVHVYVSWVKSRVPILVYHVVQ